MRKFTTALLAGAMVLSLTACGSDNDTKKDDATKAPTATEQSADDTKAPESDNKGGDEATAAADYKLGMGIVVADNTKEGTAQIDATVATVTTDKDGKIVSCYIDVAQTKVAIADGEIGTEVDLRTKQEKGSDYGMVAYGNAIAEWNEQADFFASKVVGLTGDEVAALATETNEEGHNVSTDADMLAGCTMDITAFKEAVAKACKDEYAKSFKATAGEMKLGLSVITDTSESTAVADDADGCAKIYSEFAAVVVDKDGKIIADLCDAIQPKISFDKTGAETEYTFKATKKELKTDYNMVAYGNSIAEWMDQATTFENYIVGKDSAGVAGIATEVNAEGHSVATSADADLLAGCTISIKGFQDTIVKAIGNAR